MHHLTKFVLLFSLWFSGGVTHAIVVNASGEGWCIKGASCNNTDPHVIANTYSSYNLANWFAFQIPNLSGFAITGATIHIWNSSSNFTNVATALYELRGSVESAIDYDFLTYNHPTVGSVLVSDADTFVDHYVSIALNASALEQLNGFQGHMNFFTGTVDVQFGNHVDIFGGTNGNPIAFLDLSLSSIPEPSTLGLAALGLAGLGFSRRRGG